MSGSSRKASSPSWRARSGEVAQLREQPGRRLPPAGEGRRPEPGGQVGVAGDQPGVEQAEPCLRVGRGDDTASEMERTEWSSRTPASQIGYQSASATAAISGRSSWTRTRSRSPCGGSSRRPRLPTATSAIPSVPVRGGGPPRRCFGGGVPPSASASSPRARSPPRRPFGAVQARQCLHVQHVPSSVGRAAGRPTAPADGALSARRPRVRPSAHGRSRRSWSPRPCRHRSAR